MTADRGCTIRKLEAVLDYISINAEKVVDAHLDLGIPLEDIISSAAKRVLSSKIVDSQKQLKLFLNSDDT